MITRNKNIIKINAVIITILFIVLSLTSCPKAPLNPWDEEGVSLGLVTTAPSISIAEGVYNKDISVEISCDDPDAVIYYTTDGSDPDETSEVFSGTIDISGDGISAVVKAVAINPSKVASHVTAASYNIEYFSLNVSAGSNGSVTPAAAVKVAQDGSTEITATPDSTYAFSHWSVESGEGVVFSDIYSETTIVTLTETGGTVKANFAAGISLTVGNDGNGTTEPDGEIFVADEVPRTINAVPDYGYQFKQWSVVSGSISFDDSSSVQTQVTLTGGSGSIRADFEPLEYDLTIFPTASGNSTPSGTVIVQHDVSRAISATASEGWVFSYWSVISGSGVSFADVNSAATTVTLTDGDAVIQPNYAVERALTISDDGNGSTTPAAGVYDVADGAVVAISASPDTGFGFSHWSSSGSAVVADANGASTTVTLSGGDGTVTANFTDNAYALTVQSGGNGTVNPSGTFDVVHGVETDISATATTAHYVFDSWSIESGTAAFGNSGSASTTVLLTSGAATIQANFELETYALTMTDNGFGSTSSDATVTYNVPHAISATPDTGYEFDSWQVTSGTASIADSGSASTNVTLTAGAATLQAVFTPLDYTLTVSNDGNGSTSPSGSQTVSHAAATAISATANANYDFDSWSVTNGTASFDDENAASTNVTLLNGNAAIQANFVLETYALTITDNGFGSTSSDAIVTYGVAHSISATPDTGYEFDSWQVTSGSGVSFGSTSSASTTVTLTGGAATIEAVFTPLDYTLTVTNNGNGTTSPAGVQTASHASTIPITATPNSGYGFSSWTVISGSGAVIDDSLSETTTITLTDGDVTIQANFYPTYVLSVTNNENGTTSPSGSIVVTQGITTSISAAANNNYDFKNWSVESGTASIANTNSANTTVILSSGPATIQANFELETYLLTIMDNGYGSTTTSTVVTYGVPFSISAVPDSGFTFDSWSVISGIASIADPDSVSTTVTLTSGAATIIAKYKPKIGTFFQGGIVFYLDGSGNGLIAAESDQGTGNVWGGTGTAVGGTLTTQGSGAANTAAIVSAYGLAEPYQNNTDYAAKICYDLVQNGYSDWFLPSRDELLLMYEQKEAIGGFSDVLYWSSSEDNEYPLAHAWLVHFLNGSSGTAPWKYYPEHVRATRSFTLE